MRVTIILDSGGFLTNESAGESYLDVGYFETSGANDVEVVEDGKLTQPPPNTRLGKHKDKIEVEHLGADGRVKTGVTLLPSFKKDILRKTDLYPTDTPDFDPAQFDCILRFQSGNFESADVRERDFKEHRVRDDGATGKSKKTRKIANDILVHYDAAAGEELRLRRADGTNVWSSSSVGAGTTSVEVKLLSDTSLDAKYFKKALKLNGPNYHRPNPDPPPVNGNDPDPGFG
jgi:hypothetical protein